MRARVYVDGFNLYYRALKGTDYRWLNVVELSRLLLDSDDHIDMLRYFTARVSGKLGKPTAPRDQQIYLNALGTLPSLTAHFGNFIINNKMMRVHKPEEGAKCWVKVICPEEKGSDVNLAVHMLNDAMKDEYDVALMLSQDTDLVEPMRLVREAGKVVVLGWLDGREPSREMLKYASGVRHINPGRLSASQFPDVLIGKGGSEIRKPEGW